LRDALKDLKIGNSNEEGIDEAILQFNEVLARFKAMKGHATKNVFKWRQILLMGNQVGVVTIKGATCIKVKVNFKD
jgi:hypothetical protein